MPHMKTITSVVSTGEAELWMTLTGCADPHRLLATWRRADIPAVNTVLTLGVSSVADLGFLDGGVLLYSCMRNSRSHAHFRLKPRPFSIVLRATTSPTSPIDRFLNEFSAEAC